MAECSIDKSNLKQVAINFVASITVPMGFTIFGDGYDERYPYQTYISLDKDAYNQAVDEETFEATVSVPVINGTAGETRELKCMVPIQAVKAVGPLFYNSVVTGFMPVEELNALTPEQLDPPQDPSLISDDDVIVTNPTAFSDSKPLNFELAVAYECAGCDITDEFIKDNFIAEIIQKQEFVIDELGNRYYHDLNDPNQEFMNHLKGDATQVIHIPYTLMLIPRE